MGVISKVVVDITYNSGPQLGGNREIRVPKTSKPYSFRLPRAYDAEKDPLTYSVVSQVTQGTLNCQEREDIFHCTYTLPENLDTNRRITFAYRANDGKLNSNTSYITLNPVDEGLPIVQLAAGSNHNCAPSSATEALGVGEGVDLDWVMVVLWITLVAKIRLWFTVDSISEKNLLSLRWVLIFLVV